MVPRFPYSPRPTTSDRASTAKGVIQRRRVLCAAAAILMLMASVHPVVAQGTRRRPAGQAPAARFRTTLTPDQMKGKQAVVQTTMGTFVIQLLPEAAPNHVAYVIDRAGAG